MKIKFGIQIEPQFGFSYDMVKKIALKGENLGYTSIWSSDHFFLDENSEEINCMEAWTLLGALAAETSTIRLGTLVTSMSYRYPAVLAKIAATVDHISDGRLEFGIGAGWKEIEYDAYGIPFPPISERMDQLEEGMEIIKRLWTEPKASFEGKYYNIEDAISAPKPTQKPMPPVFIGGSGKKRTMNIVAKYADYLNLPFTPVDEIPDIFNALRGHCDEVGRNFDDIGKSYFTQLYVSESEEDIDDEIEKYANWSGREPDDLMQRIENSSGPGKWWGTPEQVLERLEYLIDMGFDYFNLMFPYQSELKSIDNFANLIIPKVNN